MGKSCNSTALSTYLLHFLKVQAGPLSVGIRLRVRNIASSRGSRGKSTSLTWGERGTVGQGDPLHVHRGGRAELKGEGGGDREETCHFLIRGEGAARGAVWVFSLRTHHLGPFPFGGGRASVRGGGDARC